VTRAVKSFLKTTQIHKSTNPQIHKSTNPQIFKSSNLQTSKTRIVSTKGIKMPFQPRRNFLKSAAFAAAAFSTPGLFAEELTRTANQGEGPFYPDKLPLDTDNDLILLNDSITPAVGEIAHLTGKILDQSGAPIRNAVVEIWQADNTGAYIHTRARREKMDKNFQGFGRFLTSSTGEYYFRCIKPSKYVGRTPHIHYAIYQNNKRVLTTQLYIKDNPQNDKDFLYNRAKTKEAKATLVTEFTPIPDSKTGELRANWDVVIGVTPADKKQG
jgi:protocatechuate 3,4-dioxygenase beta subunit